MMAERHDASPFGPFCRHLQAKKLYFREAPARTEEELLDGSGHCWCRRTMTILGPHGDIADPSECRSGRACFEPVGTRTVGREPRP